MNKFQKIAYKMAKLEQDSGKLEALNSIKLLLNRTYKTDYKILSFEDVQREWYNKLKKGTIEQAYDVLNRAREDFEYIKLINGK